METQAFASTSKGGVHLLFGGVLLFVALALVLIGFTAKAGAAVGPTDLQLTKSDSPDPVVQGAPLTYTISVANLGAGGTADASNVVVTDTLDNQLDFVSASASQGSCEEKGKKVTCTLGQVNAGATATVTIVVRPKRTGTISNTATVTSPEDTTPANNTDTETTTVIAGPTCGGSAATIVGTDGNDVIVGTAGNDVIVALEGDDQVLSGDGKDRVCGNGGIDLVALGAKADFASGGGAADKLVGNSGADVLKGKRGPDKLRGKSGADTLNGGRGNDSCKGGAGADVEKRC